MTRRLIVSVCLLTGLAFAQDAAPDRLVVQTKDGVQDDVASLVAAKHGTIISRIPDIHSFVISVPANALGRVQQALENTGLFTVVEKDGIAYAGVVPNDPDFGSQWHLTKIWAPYAWTLTYGSSTVPIAILDSGVNSAHPDLSSKVMAGWNFLSGTSNTADVNGHGTWVSGTAAAATNNGVGVAGVNWASKIMPLVVVNSSGYAFYSNIANAITYAANHGVRIVNISIAGTMSSSILQNAVNYAWSKGAVVFAAAGNSNSSSPNYPAACHYVVAVAATTASDTKASFSNYGTWITLSAPGTGILTTTKAGGYGSVSGTSFATPIVAATAALMLSVKPTLSASSLVSLLETTADDLGTPGYDPYFGWGRVDAYKAVQAATTAR